MGHKTPEARKAYNFKNRIKLALRQHNYYQRLRLIALQTYSAVIPFCKCCGEGNLEFLALDHVNGGGTQHRKEIGKGCRIYVWLMKNQYPKGFQVLCHNCNMAKGFYGACPHRKGAIINLIN